MKKLIFLVAITLGTFTGLQAQTTSRPANAKDGKCYIRTLKSFDKKIEWKTIKCKNKRAQIAKNSEVLASTEFKQHQQRLVTLGYLNKATGYFDDEFILAHNTYIANKKRPKKT